MPFDQNSPEFQKQWAKIVAQAWADEQFKQRLLSDTTTVLKEHEIEIPEGVNITITEAAPSPLSQGQPGNKISFFAEQLNTDAIAVAAGAASSEQLSQPVTGGGTAGTGGSLGSAGTICATIGSFGTAGTAGSSGAGLTLPQAPSPSSSEQLSQPVTGGGTAGSVGTAGCFGTICGTGGSILTGGSAGTGGAGLTLPQAPPSSSEQLSQPLTGSGTAGTGGTAGTAGTICGTAACVFCAGTAGTGGAGLTLPQPPQRAAQSTSLQQPITGGSTAGSTGSIGSFGTFCGTTGSFATAGTAGTGGAGLTLPQPPQRAAQSTSLQQPITGGSTAGSAGTLGSVGTLYGTLGSVLCSGTAGTGGSGLTLPPPPSAPYSLPLQQPVVGGSSSTPDTPAQATVGTAQATVGTVLCPCGPQYTAGTYATLSPAASST